MSNEPEEVNAMIRELLSAGRIVEAQALACIEWFAPFDNLVENIIEFSRQVDKLAISIGEQIIPAFERISQTLNQIVYK